MTKRVRIALVGNPNTGKSTLFNLLTGLNQKIGNFPGITVERKTGYFKLSNGTEVELTDLPGTYSLYPKSKDESIVFQVLADKNDPSHPDIIVVIGDVTNLRRNLLLYTQVADLGIPVVLALNMTDLAKKEGIIVDFDKLAERLGVQVVPIAARKGAGIEKLKEAISNTSMATQLPGVDVLQFSEAAILAAQRELNIDCPYLALQILHQHQTLAILSPSQQESVNRIIEENKFVSSNLQAAETQFRYRYLSTTLTGITEDTSARKKFLITDRIDKIVTHKVWGFLIFIGILFFIFNAIFSWAAYPMSLIEKGFVWLADSGHTYLPVGIFANLLLDGILAGLGGIFIFIPQIAILFAFISILEDTGYMSRVTFMMDKIMRKFGLSGKSVVPMIGGLACAVPSIMSARNIENWKDRIITIMVTPLISCSARLPVYILLISLVVPSRSLWGIFSLQGLALMGMYLISTVAAILVAWVMKVIIRTKEKSYFIMELPVYRMPRWKNVIYTMYSKAKTFVVEAGKIIIAISIVLWVLASYGPGDRFERIEKKYAADTTIMTEAHRSAKIASEKLENSYIGIAGHAIEPVIRPLGYDWKIGIALITSFAAREAFVGTMATIYSVDGGDGDTNTIRERMGAARNPDTGLPIYTFATGFSLMLFYAFAMQCMSTVAIVYHETKGWKWPLIQLSYMTALAYIASFIAYQLLK